MIRRSPWPGFLVKDLTDLADQANRHGLTELPISIYRPGKHKGQRWTHSTLQTGLIMTVTRQSYTETTRQLWHRVVVFR